MSEDATLLLIEDDDGHALLIARNLLRTGVTSPIRRFRDGSEALAWFAGQPPAGRHLLLLDLRLPGIDGLEVLERLRDLPAWHGLPIVVLTTADDDQEIQRCYDLGCSLYLTKPVLYQEFVETIEMLGRFLVRLRLPVTPVMAGVTA